MDFTNIVYAKEGAIARMTVNRPEKRNALNRAARLEMLAALEDAGRDGAVQVLVVAGAGGKAFVAGSDLTELQTFSPLDMEEFMATLAQQFYNRFELLPKPVIAMIDGLCLGGGLELAMACDIRLASEGSRFGQPEINLGIIPGGGGTQRLARLVGLGKAKEMIFTGDTIDAAEALTMGLINRVYPADKLAEATNAMAARICRLSPLALKWAKKAVNASQEVSLSRGLDYEALVECLLFTSKDRDEGIKAFFEKRPAVFKGQ
jgi:enoyl-CoA hydratase